MVAPATITVFDNIYDTASNAVAGANVNCVLNSNTETTAGGLIGPRQQSTTTDSSGRFAFIVVCNDLLSPANSTYTIQTPFRTYDIAPQSANGSSQQTTAANVIVNTPSALTPSTSNITGNLTVAGTLTVAGLVTAQAGLTVSAGTFSIPAGGFSMAGPLTLTAATSQIIPGATSMSLRNNANSADNLLVSNAGAATVRAGLTVTTGGGVITAGGLTVTGAPDLTLGTAASRIKPGVTSLSLRNNANNADNLLLTDAGNATIRGSLTVSGGPFTLSGGSQTITTGNLTLTAGNLTMSAAASKIVPGATSFAIRNNADSQNNLLLSNAGALTLLPNSGGSPPTTNWGTVPVKLDDQSTASAANLTLAVPSGGLYRALMIDIMGRSDQAGAQALVIQFNADTAANYDYQSVNDTNVTWGLAAPSIASTTGKVGTLTASGAPAGSVANYQVRIQNADSTALQKPWHFIGGRFDADAAANTVFEQGHGKWRNTTTAITSIKISPAAGNLINFRAILTGLP